MHLSKKISAVIITKNEEANIAKCLQSVKGVVDEIVVIDAFSTDKTTEIAQSLGAKIIQKEWEGYSQGKNYGNSIAQHEWILSIDADEVLSFDLIHSLQKTTLDTNFVYNINRLTNYCGHWIRHSGWHPDWNIRLFNKKIAIWKGDFVHEKLEFLKPVQVVHLDGLLYHYSYQNSQDHWNRIEKYAQLSAQQMLKDGKTVTFLKLYLSPIARFFRTYFFKLGFLDGKSGWIISIRNAYLVHRKYQMLQQMQTKG